MSRAVSLVVDWRGGGGIPCHWWDWVSSKLETQVVASPLSTWQPRIIHVAVRSHVWQQYAIPCLLKQLPALESGLELWPMGSLHPGPRDRFEPMGCGHSGPRDQFPPMSRQLTGCVTSTLVRRRWRTMVTSHSVISLLYRRLYCLCNNLLMSRTTNYWTAGRWSLSDSLSAEAQLTSAVS